MKWQLVKMGSFLSAREERFKPNAPKIQNLKRIEKIDFSGNIRLSEKSSNTDMILIKKGDLVISGINVEKGAMSVYLGEDDITATIHYSSYVFDESKIDIGFLRNFLKSPEFIEALKEQVPGGIKTEIKPKHILSLNVFIPTELEIQRQLVANIDSENVKINGLSFELTHQLDLVKQLRQAFLREAMQGKLTEAWRASHPELASGPNSASQLLAKIKAAKETLVNKGKLKKQKPLSPIMDDQIPFDLPASWIWCRLGEITDFITKGTTPKKFNKDSGVPYLKVYNIVNQKIDFWYKPQFVDKETHEGLLNRSKVYPGDVIMNIVGPPLGKVAIIPNTFPEWNINQALSIFRPIIPEINMFIYWYLCFGIEIKNLRVLGVAGQDNISLEQCRNVIFPLSPLSEQQLIVTKLDELMQYCDQLEESIKTSQRQNEMLLQQVLREALEPKTKLSGI